jgi:hypothetical protein
MPRINVIINMYVVTNIWACAERKDINEEINNAQSMRIMKRKNGNGEPGEHQAWVGIWYLMQMQESISRSLG